MAGTLGSAQRAEYTVIGDTVNVAARLCSNAGSGEVLVGARTAEIAAVQGLEPIAPLKVKGKAEPLGVESTVLYQALRDGWGEVESETSSTFGLPKRVAEQLRRYSACGVLRHGFVQVKCADCSCSTLIAFSCKARLCPSCGARRAEEVAAHLGRVLPRVGFRQWTLSLRWALRWKVVKRPKLLRRLCAGNLEPDGSR